MANDKHVTDKYLISVMKDSVNFLSDDGTYRDIFFHCSRNEHLKTNMDYCELNCERQSSCDTYAQAEDTLKEINDEE